MEEEFGNVEELVGGASKRDPREKVVEMVGELWADFSSFGVDVLEGKLEFVEA